MVTAARHPSVASSARTLADRVMATSHVVGSRRTPASAVVAARWASAGCGEPHDPPGTCRDAIALLCRQTSRNATERAVTGPLRNRDRLAVVLPSTGVVPLGCGLGVQHPRELLALDVEVRQYPVEPAGKPPGAVAEQRHDGGHDGHADEEGIHEDTHRKGETDRLDDRLGGGHEASKHPHHDYCGRGDHPGALTENQGHPVVGGGTLNVVPPHAGHPEPFLVH